MDGALLLQWPEALHVNGVGINRAAEKPHGRCDMDATRRKLCYTPTREGGTLLIDRWILV